MKDAIMARWITAVLSNDESSTDEELFLQFTREGVPESVAIQAVAHRNEYLKGML